MANVVKHKRSSTSGETPSASDLDVGEIAVNTADGKLFVKHTDGTVVEISGGGGGGSVSTLSDATITSLGDGELLVYDTTSSKWINQTLSEAGIAALASPGLTGTPTAPTASAATNSTQIATTAYVTTAVSNLVDSAPGTLNTLNELAAALGDDANFSTTVTNSIATKLPLAGGTMTGALTVSSTITATGNIYSRNGDNSDIVIGEHPSYTSYGAVWLDGESDYRFLVDPNGGHTFINALGAGHIYLRNDNDTLVEIPDTGGLLIGGNTAFHDGYHPNADKWTTSRTLSLSGDASGSVSWDGSANATLSVTVANDSHTHNKIIATDDRDMKPSTSGITSGVKAIRPFFSSFGGMTGTDNSTYLDVLAFDTYSDSSGGGPSAITFHKGAANGSPIMYIWKAGFDANTWGTGQRVFADNYHPNADKWTTARTLSLSGDASGSVSWDGSANATLSVAVTNDSHTHDGRYYTETEADSRFVNVTGDSMTGTLTLHSGQTYETRLGRHPLHSTYGGLWNDDYTSSNTSGYMILSAGSDTYINGSSVYIRGGNNSNSNELRVTTSGTTIGGNTVFHDGYHPNADTLTTARTINGVSFNGSANITVADSTKLPLAGGTMTGQLTISGSSPQLKWNDTDSGADDFWIHVNSNIFYILTDRDDNDSWDGAYPLTLNNSNAQGHLYGSRLFADNYHPNADKWTTARTLSLSGDASGSVSWDGSANATLSVTVSNDSHNHDGRYYTETEADSRFVNVSGDTMSGNLDFNNNQILNLNHLGLDGIIYHVGDTNTYHEFPTTDAWRVAVGGSERLKVQAGTGGGGSPHVIVTGDLKATSNIYVGGDYVWHQGNDGSGSGLDADLLDGVHGSSFLRSDVEDSGVGINLNGGTLSQGNDSTLYVTAGNNADWGIKIGATSGKTEYGQVIEMPSSFSYAFRVLKNGTEHFNINSTGATIGGNYIWHAGNDGSGSGLDADVLDGVHGSSFLRSDADDTYAGNLTVNGITLKNNSNVTRNLKLQPSSSTTDVGLSMFYGNGSHGLQLYGSSTYYGFLDGNWASWDIRKQKNGNFEVDEGSGLQRVFNDGYHPNADKWTSSRTLSLTGDVTGSVSWDGSGNASLSTTVGNDSHTHSQVAGLSVHTGRNNEANKVVRTQSNGYVDFGWINTTSGTAGTIDRIYCSQDAYIRYLTPASFRSQVITGHYLPLGGGTLTGDVQFNSGANIHRGTHSSGYLVGSYNSVGANSTKSNPIYTIGSNYQPSDTDLVNMYGIGYSNGGAAFDGISSVLSGWGLYVAADGDARIGLDASYGNINLTGTVDGRDVAADGTKLDTIATNANNYVHPTGNGNNHIPSGGQAETFLKYSSAGTATWSVPWTRFKDGDGDQIYANHNHSVKFKDSSSISTNWVSTNPLNTDWELDIHVINYSIGHTKMDIGNSGSADDVTGAVLVNDGSNGFNWAQAGGGATGGGSDQVFYENDTTVTTSYTITNNKNAMSAGPITINSGVTVTVGTGEAWTVI